MFRNDDIMIIICIVRGSSASPNKRCFSGLEEAWVSQDCSNGMKARQFMSLLIPVGSESQQGNLGASHDVIGVVTGKHGLLLSIVAL